MRRDGEAYFRQKVKGENEKKIKMREGEQASKRAAGVLGQMRFSVTLNQPE